MMSFHNRAWQCRILAAVFLILALHLADGLGLLGTIAKRSLLRPCTQTIQNAALRMYADGEFDGEEDKGDAEEEVVFLKGGNRLVFGIGYNSRQHSTYREALGPDGKWRTVKCYYYQSWKSILKKCSPDFQEMHTEYLGCSVCDEWKNYDTYRAWHVEQERQYKGGDDNGSDGDVDCQVPKRDLNKNILVRGNKYFSPETCVFVPPVYNNLLNDPVARRGAYPYGVYRENNGTKPYKADIRINTRKSNVGRFATVEEAEKRYLEAKSEYVEASALRLASAYDRRTREALLRWAREFREKADAIVVPGSAAAAVGAGGRGESGGIQGSVFLVAPFTGTRGWGGASRADGEAGRGAGRRGVSPLAAAPSPLLSTHGGGDAYTYTDVEFASEAAAWEAELMQHPDYWTWKVKHGGRLIHGVGRNDADYVTQPTLIVDGKKKQVICPYFSAWKSMLNRCYSDAWHEKNPTCVGCTICEEWHWFSNFRAWMIQQESGTGRQLDKDILVRDSTQYSPETCIFVTHAVNSLLNDHGAARGEWPQGVSKHACGRFQARIAEFGKLKGIGLYDTPEEASHAYLLRKAAQILEVARLLDEQSDERLRLYDQPVIAALREMWAPWFEERARAVEVN